MPDPIQTAPAPTQVDPKTVANNISKGIQDKANGKAPSSQPQENGQTPVPAIDPNAGKEKYVVDGKEIWLTPEQARAYVQKGISFEPKVDQLHYLQKETNQFLQTLATDPLKILTDKRIGMTPEAVMEKIFSSGQISDEMKEKVGKWYYDNVVEPLKMTPEQLKAREDAKYRSERERQDAAAKDMAIKQDNQRRVELALNQIKAQIGEAMKESGLPSNDTPLGAEMARMVADVMRLAQFQRQSITPKQAIELVKTRIKSVQASYYDHLDEEALVKELGEKNAEKVKKYFLKLVKEAEKKPIVPLGKPVARNGERKTITPDDMADYLAELKRKG
jgi:hypothetical protein